MTIAIPPDLQQALAEYARRQNKPVEQYVLDLLRVAVAPLTGPRSPQETAVRLAAIAADAGVPLTDEQTGREGLYD